MLAVDSLHRGASRAAALAALGTVVVAMVAFVVPAASGARAAAAAPAAPAARRTAGAATTMSDQITIRGHGWGHGRGMGQWGAYGYAVNQRWSWQQITDHFYGGSVAGSIGNPQITIALSQLSPSSDLGTGAPYPDTTVVLANGPLRYVTPDGAVHGVFGHAVRLRRVGAARFAVQVAPGCGGPWTDAGTESGGTIRVVPANPGSEAVGDTLGMCEPSQAGYERHVLGEIRAVDTGSGQATVNALPVDSYIRSVVPREMSASWGDAAGGAGMNALQAQAVAARSYGLASNRLPYADTCDSICQSYPGRWIVQGGRTSTVVDPRTDWAVGSTSGQVRMIGGRVVATEFSSSSGGYTAGGVFTAVVDDGDAVAGNPNHSWTTTLARTTIEQRYGKGSLQAINVTSRNGLGDYGGRVQALTLQFSGGSVSLTGEDFRIAFGLKSNWFQVDQAAQCDPVSSPAPPFASITAMVAQQYRDVLARDPDGNAAVWAQAIACHKTTPQAVVTAFLTSHEADLVFGQVVRLYVGVLGRNPDTGGAFGWQAYVRDGMTTPQLVASFVNSPEFRSLHPTTSSRQFVTEMYRQMFGRDPDAGGLTFWTAWLDSGHTRADFVYRLFVSAEFDSHWHLTALIHEAYLAMLRRTPDLGGFLGWYQIIEQSGGSPQPLVDGIYGSSEYRNRFS